MPIPALMAWVLRLVVRRPARRLATCLDITTIHRLAPTMSRSTPCKIPTMLLKLEAVTLARQRIQPFTPLALPVPPVPQGLPTLLALCTLIMLLSTTDLLSKAEQWLINSAIAALLTSSLTSGEIPRVLVDLKITPRPLASANTASSRVQHPEVPRAPTTTDDAGRQIALVLVQGWTNSAATHLQKTKAVDASLRKSLGSQPFLVGIWPSHFLITRTLMIRIVSSLEKSWAATRIARARHQIERAELRVVSLGEMVATRGTVPAARIIATRVQEVGKALGWAVAHALDHRLDRATTVFAMLLLGPQ